MAWSKALTLSLHPFKSNNSSIFITNPIFSPSYSPFSSSCSSTLLGINTYNSNSKLVAFNLPLQKNPSIFINFICKAAEYKFSDPISEFAESIFENFLHTEYGGPGTLLVLPFIDMADTLNERGLPGEPQAARAAVKWAQENVDKDWKEWTGSK
ncbi:protein PLASTID REDOX INSENSITIVE 2, chloroplastic-like isoform X1 [Amaranthus tricolor]|uniref:protein PLASTID REDOX INSENSITIVE 2, chloroplastic-like isoform X1 n=1 Tax=Amaranthus tricolor TaxID=29722 RepID=UPI002589239A|nr:protein PLASTID REDOX INSENSITIVE 2, chloroplastic-like isoform X1 [Amaranthus tricolor]